MQHLDVTCFSGVKTELQYMHVDACIPTPPRLLSKYEEKERVRTLY